MWIWCCHRYHKQQQNQEESFICHGDSFNRHLHAHSWSYLTRLVVCTVLFVLSACMAQTPGLRSAAWASLGSASHSFQQGDGKREAQGSDWFISRFDRDRFFLFSAVVCGGFSKIRGFDAGFIWQLSKDSRETGIYQHKMNWHERVGRTRRDAVGI